MLKSWAMKTALSAMLEARGKFATREGYFPRTALVSEQLWNEVINVAWGNKIWGMEVWPSFKLAPHEFQFIEHGNSSLPSSH